MYSDYLYFTKKNKSVTAFHEDVLTSIQNLEACTQQRTLRSCVYDKRVANGKTKVSVGRVGVGWVIVMRVSVVRISVVRVSVVRISVVRVSGEGH